jgi:hypothetical protein
MTPARENHWQRGSGDHVGRMPQDPPEQTSYCRHRDSHIAGCNVPPRGRLSNEPIAKYRGIEHRSLNAMSKATSGTPRCIDCPISCRPVNALITIIPTTGNTGSQQHRGISCPNDEPSRTVHRLSLSCVSHTQPKSMTTAVKSRTIF